MLADDDSSTRSRRTSPRATEADTSATIRRTGRPGMAIRVRSRGRGRATIPAMDRPTGVRDLWRRPMFRRFWIGETISFLGSQITDLALPLTAVLALGATADQMGLLTATWYLPYLVFGLPAGVWVDRMRRRPILVGLDLIAAATVVVVPIAAWTDLLRIEVLYPL